MWHDFRIAAAMPVALVLSLLLVQPALGPVGQRTAELQLAPGTQVQAAALSDGFDVGLLLGQGDAAQLRRTLQRLDPVRVRLFAPAARELGALVTFAQPVKAARITQRKDRPGTVRLEVDLDDPIAALCEHVFDEPLPLPVSLEARTLREADALLQTHHIAEAVLLLQRLERAYPLRAWVLLRLGDVALFDGQINQACELWQDAIANGRERVSARLARLRGFVADCKLTEAPEWAAMLGREGRDDPVGRQSALEAAWALGTTTSIPVIRQVLDIHHSHRAQLPPELEQQLMARLVRLGSPFEIASLLADSSVQHHPEGFDLALLGAEARCALDIPNTLPPVGELSASRSWMQLTAAKKHLWRRRALGCQLLRDAGPATWPQGTLLATRGLNNTPVSKDDVHDSNAPHSESGAPQAASEPVRSAANIVAGAASDPVAHLAQLAKRISDAQAAVRMGHAAPAVAPQTSASTAGGLP